MVLRATSLLAVITELAREEKGTESHCYIAYAGQVGIVVLGRNGAGGGRWQ